MTEAEATTLGHAILSEVTRRLPIPGIREAAAAAGIDASRIPATSEARGGMGSRAEVTPALHKLFSELSHDRKERALPILAERVMARDDEAYRGLMHLLQQHGYEFEKGAFVRIGVIDEREVRYLPASATAELAKAIARLSADDQSGAITAACGAVDATTTALYEKHNLGDPGASFQTKVNTVIGRLKIIEKLEKELTEVGVKPVDARKIAEEIHEATKHATEALQVIRRTSGDVHGTKPTYTRTVYDTIKWASAICGLFEGE
ncbi:MAG TPA: hypothetical protein VE077_14980 [Candidatus Methylomirabilis sp.]|nr:hypothetical protein [Candidatus Methylomirabilis sp.]